MEHAVYTGRIEHHGPEVGDFGAGVHAFAHNVIAGGRLLPGVGDHNPDGRKHGAEPDAEGGDEVDGWFHAVPTENQDSQEAAF